MSESKLVYSTETGRMCPKCGRPQSKCACKKKKSKAQFREESDGVIRIRRESKGRKGKTVTTISGFREKDGVLVALLAAAAAAERPVDDRVDALLDEFGEIHQGKVSVDCPDGRKAPVIEELEGVLPDEVAGVAVEGINTVDGFKIALADGTWVLVRPSGTEPKMRVYAEAGSEGRVDELLSAGRDLVEPLV